MSQRLQLAVKILLVLASVTILILASFYFALHRVPDFYDQATRVAVADQQQASEQLERQALELHNQARHDGSWSIAFSEQQINGWLAAGLPENFPELLPREIGDPRVSIDPRQIRLAFRYQGPRVSSIVQLVVEVQLTEEENTVAIRIVSARAGLVPLPLKDFLDQISTAARQSDLDLRWAQMSEDPVALLKIPSKFPAIKKKRVHLDAVELRPGEIVLEGTTEANSGA